MKKIVLTLGVVLFSIVVVKAQNIRWGVRGGLNFSKVKVVKENHSYSYKGRDYDYDHNNYGRKVKEWYVTKGKKGFYIGGFIEFPFSKMNEKFIGEVGLNYSTVGGVIPREKGTIIEELITLPILLKYEVAKNAYIKGGASLSYLLSFGIKKDGKVDEPDLEEIVLEFSIPIGVEYNLYNGIFFNLDYNLGFGLFSLDGEEGDFGKLNLTMKNRVFQLGLGYKF